LLDFGVARLRGETGVEAGTGGAQPGPPSYLSPEQCQGAPAALDARVDIYALGTILYEMLCGRPPFLGPAPAEVRVLHLMQPPPAPRVWNPSLSPAVEAVVLRALAKHPGDRHASMAELWQALEAARDAPLDPAPPLIEAPVAVPAAIAQIAQIPQITDTFGAVEITAIVQRRGRTHRWRLAGVAAVAAVALWLAAPPVQRPAIAPAARGPNPVAPASPAASVAPVPPSPPPALPAARPQPPTAPPPPPPPAPSLASDDPPRPSRLAGAIEAQLRRRPGHLSSPLARPRPPAPPRAARPPARRRTSKAAWMDKW
jgi:serine/threonine-protein kinase